MPARLGGGGFLSKLEAIQMPPFDQIYPNHNQLITKSKA